MKVMRDTVRDTMEGGLDRIDRYRPFVMRHRWTLLAVGAATIVTAGAAAVVVARRRRARPLTVRIQQALPEVVNERLVRPLNTLREGLTR
jgi:hypothetical protein